MTLRKGLYPRHLIRGHTLLYTWTVVLDLPFTLFQMDWCFGYGRICLSKRDKTPDQDLK